MIIVYLFLIVKINATIKPITKYSKAIAKQENLIVAIIAAMSGANVGIVLGFWSIINKKIFSITSNIPDKMAIILTYNPIF